MLADFKLSGVSDIISAIWDTIAKLGNLGLRIEAKYWRLVSLFTKAHDLHKKCAGYKMCFIFL